MDKKIILSILIVALIGIVAATYQIKPGQDILNPLASVETEEAPLTDVLTAPEQSQQQAQAEADSQAKQKAQAEAQAQQAQDQAKAQAQAEADNPNAQGDSAQAGATSQSSIINSENPVVIPASGDSNGGSSAADSNQGSAQSGGNDGNSGSGSADSNTQGSTDSSGNSANSQDSNNPSGDTNGAPSDETINPTNSGIDDATWSEIDSIIQKAKNNFAFGIYADRDSCSVDDNGLYKVNLYNSETNAFVGTLFVNINKNSQDYGHWYLIDVDGNVQGPDAPMV